MLGGVSNSNRVNQLQAAISGSAAIDGVACADGSIAPVSFEGYARFLKPGEAKSVRLRVVNTLVTMNSHVSKTGAWKALERAGASEWGVLKVKQLRKADNTLQGLVAKYRQVTSNCISRYPANEAALSRAAALAAATRDTVDVVGALGKHLFNLTQAATETCVKAQDAQEIAFACPGESNAAAALEAIEAAAVALDHAASLARAASQFSALCITADKGARNAEKASRDVALAETVDERDEAFQRVQAMVHDALQKLTEAIEEAATAGVEASRIAEARARVIDAPRADPLVTASRAAERIAAAVKAANVTDNLHADALYRDLLVSHVLQRSRVQGRQLSQDEQRQLANEAANYVRDMSPVEAKKAYQAGLETANRAHHFAAALVEVDVESRKERGRLVSSLTEFVTSALESASNAALRYGVNLKNEAGVVTQSLAIGIERAMAELTEEEALDAFDAATAKNGAGQVLLAAIAAEVDEKKETLKAEGVQGSPYATQSLHAATEYMLRALGKRGGFCDDEINQRLTYALNPREAHKMPLEALECREEFAKHTLAIGTKFSASASAQHILMEARGRIETCATSFIASDDFVALLRCHTDNASNLAGTRAFVLEKITDLVTRLPPSKLKVLDEGGVQETADRLVAIAVRNSSEEIGRIARAVPKDLVEPLEADVEQAVTQERLLNALRECNALYSDEPSPKALETIRTRTVDKIVEWLGPQGAPRGVAAKIDDERFCNITREVLGHDIQLQAELNNHEAMKKDYLDRAPDALREISSKLDRSISKEKESYYDYLIKECVEIRGEQLCAARTTPDQLAQEILDYVYQLENAEVKTRLRTPERALEKAMAVAKLFGEEATRNTRSNVAAFQALEQTLQIYGTDVTLGRFNAAVMREAEDAFLVKLTKRLPLSSQLRKGPEALFTDALKKGSAARRVLACEATRKVCSERGLDEEEAGQSALAMAERAARFLAVMGSRVGFSAEEIKTRLSDVIKEDEIAAGATKEYAARRAYIIVCDAVKDLA